jgi:heat shock protein HslJ
MSMTRVSLIVLAAVGLAFGCRSTEPPPSAASLLGTSWVAEEIDGRGVERIGSTVTFETAQRINGDTGCNRYFGEFLPGEGTIALKPTGTTRIACAPPIMEQERRFLDGLAAASAFRLADGKLLLLDEGGRVRMRLAPLPPR